MNINKLYEYKLIDESKQLEKDTERFVSKYWCCLLIFSIGFITVVFYIVHNSRPFASTEETFHDNFERLVDCLISAGVDGRSIIQRSNGKNYTDINWQWNTVNGYMEPQAYLLANDVSDIQNAVICCQLSKIRLVARSGGHSLVKYGFGDANSLIVDLKKFNKILIDPIQMNCEIGPGARAAYVSYVLWKGGEFMIPTGICPTVGIGGLALGGGYGYFTRLFGLTSDSILELEMVDAKGKLLIINNRTNEDLYWALRGGGGGSFGIVTKVKFRIYPAPKYVLYGVYRYQFEHFSEYFEAWQNFITSGLPNNIGALTSTYSSSIETEIFKFYLQSNETMIADLDEVLDSFSFPKAAAQSVKIMTYYDFVLETFQHYSVDRIHQISDLASLTKHPVVGVTKVKSIYVDTILDKNKISILKNLLRDYLQHANFHIELNKGAINNFNRSDTAFVHRGENLYHIQLELYKPVNEEVDLESIAAVNEFYEASKQIFNHTESYQNYAAEDMSDYLERYYGTNLKKLTEVKMRIDPDNVFHYPQSIPVSLD